MAEPKAKTLQQKLGFFDEDLKSPVHDDILKWLDKNILMVIHSLYSIREWPKNKIDEQRKLAEQIFVENISEVEETLGNLNMQQTKILAELPELERRYSDALSLEENSTDTYKPSNFRLKEIEENKKKNAGISTEIEEQNARLVLLKSWKGLGSLPKRNEIKIIEKPWEYPVTSQSSPSVSGYRSGKNIIGFIDLKVTFTFTQLSLTGINFAKREIIGNVDWTQTERKIPDNGDYLGWNHTFFVEVKTKITSLGELFRQIRMYKEFVNGDFVIVCPDDSEKDIIQSQGFKFYKYEPDKGNDT